MKKFVNLLLLLLCSGIFLTAASGSEEDDEIGTVETSEYDTSKIYKIGEVMKCPDFDIKINNIKIKKKGTRIDSYSVVADPEWVAVNLTVKNKSKEAKTFYNSDIEFVNSNGEIIGSSIFSYDIWGSELLMSPKLSSGGSKTGFIQYSNTNTNNNNLMLNVKCNSKITYKVSLSSK